MDRTHQSHEMHRRIMLLAVGHPFQQLGIGEEGTGPDHLVDPHHFLLHDPAGAEIQVPDLG